MGNSSERTASIYLEALVIIVVIIEVAVIVAGFVFTCFDSTHCAYFTISWWSDIE